MDSAISTPPITRSVCTLPRGGCQTTNEKEMKGPLQLTNMRSTVQETAEAVRPPSNFVSCPPLSLDCAIIALEDERYRDHPKLPVRLEPYASVFAVR